MGPPRVWEEGVGSWYKLVAPFLPAPPPTAGHALKEMRPGGCPERAGVRHPKRCQEQAVEKWCSPVASQAFSGGTAELKAWRAAAVVILIAAPPHCNWTSEQFVLNLSVPFSKTRMVLKRLI